MLMTVIIGDTPEICMLADKLKQKVFIEEQGVPKDEVFEWAKRKRNPCRYLRW
ncbi:MAG: hypothetical protein FWD82_02260 [Defluviitaleaceae bacterium]|nr:hypothetical protein [Defluviitaleaceae bacterium]